MIQCANKVGFLKFSGFINLWELPQLAFTCPKSANETAEQYVNFFSKLTIKTCSGVFNVNFEQISHIILVFPLFTLNK